jgi:hypothetical protein
MHMTLLASTVPSGMHESGKIGRAEPKAATTGTGGRPARAPRLVIGVLGLAVFVVFYSWLMKLPANANLAQDELWGATLANLPFFDGIVFVLRFDVHPPIYYMQLKLWALAGHSDAWLHMNSLLWLFATALLVFRLVDRNGSRLAALVAAAMTLSTPLLAYYAFEVRMYTFLAFLTVLGAFLSERLLVPAGRSSERWEWAALFLVSVAIIYSYATGALIVGAQFVFGMATAWNARLPRRSVVRWFGLHVVLGLLTVPVAANSMLRGISHAAVPGPEVVLGTISDLFIGGRVGNLEPYMVVLQLSLLALCLLAIVRNSAARRLILSYVVLPLVASLAVSYVLAPMWLTRSFIFMIPILWIAIGRFLGREMMLAEPQVGRIFRPAIAFAALLVTLVQVEAIYRDASTPRLPNYRDLVSHIRGKAVAGDCIVAMSGMDVFWGVSRYFAGEGWDGGLRIQARPTERWVGIMEALPARLKEETGLEPVSDNFIQDGVRVFAGYPSGTKPSCNHVFLVGKSPDFPSTLPSVADAQVTERSGPVFVRELSAWPADAPTER